MPRRIAAIDEGRDARKDDGHRREEQEDRSA
jgi:hypothetical protein